MTAVVFCRVHTWPTGKRLVSLPFSDHCEPLTDDAEQLNEILSYVRAHRESDRLRHVEIRPVQINADLFQSGLQFGVHKTYYSHRVDLRLSCDDLMRSFHKDCVQRAIRRAEREGLEYREGRSEQLLRIFFDLLIKTRRKHQLPPQPITWFRNLARCLDDHLQIRVASKGDCPVAAIMTLSSKDTLVYKYGCSDPKFNKFGGTAFLLWKAIQAAKAAGLTWLDLGRSDSDNSGLVSFKDHWGATRTSLSYWRYPSPEPRPLQADWTKLAGHVFRRMPDALLVAAGRLLYRHVG
jgi:lipid II:glycine glycyltransferase (peptidoglycan interpeptide bridge formation enzyme)